MSQSVHRLHVLGDFLWGHEAGRDHPPGEPQRLDPLQKPLPPPTVSDPQQLEVGSALHQRAHGVQQIIVSLQRSQTGDGAEDEVVGGDADLSAGLGA